MFRFLYAILFAVVITASVPLDAQELQSHGTCNETILCGLALTSTSPEVEIDAFKGKGPRGVVGKGIKGAGGTKAKPLGKKPSTSTKGKVSPPGKKTAAKAAKTAKPLATTKQKAQKKPNSAGAASKLWGKGKKNTRLDNANSHWKMHKSEFPQHKTAAQYAKAAANFTRKPPKGTSTFRRKNGDKMYYHRKSNTFAVAAANGAVKTYFRPKEKQKYWRQQLKEHGK